MFYMAYGSNLNKAQMRHRCPDASVVSAGIVQDYRLVFRRGVLTIERAVGFAVPVGIWDVSYSDIISLDRYEGCPIFYRKCNFNVPCVDGKTRRVFGYVMNDGFALERPSKRYMDICLQGYHDFGFVTGALYEAVGGDVA